MVCSGAPIAKYAFPELFEEDPPPPYNRSIPTRAFEELNAHFTLNILFFELAMSVWATAMLLFLPFLDTAEDIMFQYKSAWLLPWGMVMLYFLSMVRAFRVMFVCQLMGISLHFLSRSSRLIPGELASHHLFVLSAGIATLVGILYLRL